MTCSLTKVAQAALITSCFILLAGCGSSAPPRFYTLASRPAGNPPPAGSVAGDAPTVAVSAVTIPGTLDRPQLVVFLDAQRIELFEEARWAEPLAHGIARTLAEDLQTRLGLAAVAAYPEDASARARYRISVDILHLDVASQGGVTLDAIWTIRDSFVAPLAAPVTASSADAPPLPVRTTDRSNTGHVHLVISGDAHSGGGAEASIAAQSDALAQLADQLALAFRAFQNAP